MCLHVYIYHTKCGDCVPPAEWSKPRHCEPVAAALAVYHAMPENPLTEYPLTIPRICDRRFVTSDMGVPNVNIFTEENLCPRCEEVEESAAKGKGKEKAKASPLEGNGEGSSRMAPNDSGNPGNENVGTGDIIHPYAFVDRDIVRFLDLPKEPLPYVLRPADEALEAQMKERLAKQKKTMLTKKREMKQKRIEEVVVMHEPVAHRLPFVGQASHLPRGPLAPVFVSSSLPPRRLGDVGDQMMEALGNGQQYHVQTPEIQPYQHIQYPAQVETYSSPTHQFLYQPPVCYDPSHHAVPQYQPAVIYQFFPRPPAPYPPAPPPLPLSPPRTSAATFARPLGNESQAPYVRSVHYNVPQAPNIRRSHYNRQQDGYYGALEPLMDSAILEYGRAHQRPVDGPSSNGGVAMTKAKSQKKKATIIVTGAGSPIIVDGGYGGTKRVNLDDCERLGSRPKPIRYDTNAATKEEVSLVLSEDGSIAWGNIRRKHLRSASVSAEESFCEVGDAKICAEEAPGKLWRRDSFTY